MSETSAMRSDPAAIDVQLDKARAAWLEVMSKFRGARGLVDLPAPAMLEERHFRDCRIFPSRDLLIKEMPRNGRVAEVGVQAGEFSQVLLDSCEPTKLHLIDTDTHSYDLAGRFQSQIAEGRVRVHEGVSWEVLEAFDDGYFDFAYIDADHSRHAVSKDIAVAKRKIRRDGFLVFNDYTYWSPVECMPYGVMFAVNELCIAEDWEVVCFALQPFMYCDIAIRRMTPER